jgi:hypothetical protein
MPLLDWLSFITMWTAVPLATIAVFHGTRCIAAKAGTRTAIVVLLAGLAFLLGRAAFLSWGHSSLRSTLQIVSEPTVVPKSFNEALAQLAPEEAAQRSRLLASTKFIETGELVSYTESNGGQTLYAPSQQEIATRERLQRMHTETSVRLESIKTQEYFLIIAAVVATLVGYSVGRKSAQ